MTEFLRDLELFIQAANLNNSAANAVGSSIIDDEKLYLLLMIPAIILIMVLSFTQKRQSFRTDILHGRPGLIYPVNFMGRSKRFLYGAAFGSIGYLCLRIIAQRKYVVKYTGPSSLKVFPAILSVLVYGIDFYPLFASLSVDSLLGYIIGSVYSLVLAILFFIKTFGYTKTYSAEFLFLNTLHSLPLIICLVFTTIGFPVRLYMFIRNKYTTKEKNITPPFERIQNSYHGLHVRRILQKQASCNVNNNSAMWRRVLLFIAKLFYLPKKEFQFSTRMVSVMMTGVIILYVLTAEGTILIVTGFEKAKEGQACYSELNYSLCDLMDILKDCSVASLMLSFLIGVVNILHSLSSHRSDLLALYKGNHKNIPKPSSKKLQNSIWMSASMRYSGYQLAYIGLAYGVQTATFFLLTLFCAVLVHVENYRKLLVHWLLELLVVIITFVVLMVFQLGLARFLFLQNKAETLAIDNRRGYFVFMYFMFFYNMYIGIASCVLRILKAMVIGLLFLSRLDKSNLPERYQILDPGYKSYVGFMCVESCHTNPIMITFVKLLTLSFVSSQPELPSANDRRMTLKYLIQNSFDYKEMEKSQYGQHTAKSSSIAKRRWFLFYTLLKNPQLRPLRKRYNDRVLNAQNDIHIDMI